MTDLLLIIIWFAIGYTAGYRKGIKKEIDRHKGAETDIGRRSR